MMKSMKTPLLLFALATVLLLAFVLFGPAHAATSGTGTATWSWTAPTSFTNGTAIPSTDVITYNIYTGTGGPGSEASTPTQAAISGLTVTTSGYAPGQTVCGQITAVVNGLESARSSEVCKTFPVPPAAPTGLKVQ